MWMLSQENGDGHPELTYHSSSSASLTDVGPWIYIHNYIIILVLYKI